MPGPARVECAMHGGLISNPTLNVAPAFANTNISETNHDLAVTLAAGTNRVAIAFGLFQDSSITWSSATFDPGGTAGSFSAAPSAPVYNSTGTRVGLGVFYYAISDGESSGSKTIRMVTSSSLAVLQGCYIFNDCQVPSSASTLDLSGDGSTQVCATNNITMAGGVGLTLLGMDQDQSGGNHDTTDSNWTLVEVLGTANASGIQMEAAYYIGASGTVNGGWTAGVGPPGSSVDFAGWAAELGHL